MKIYFFCALLTLNFMYSQNNTTSFGMKDPTVDEKMYGNAEPYEQADQVPEFKGDINNFRTSLINNLDVKKFNKAEKKFETDLNFIIEKDGTVSSIEAKGRDKAFNLAVESAFRKMKSEWKSAKYSHWQVRYHVSVPIFYAQQTSVTDKNLANSFFGVRKVNTSQIFQHVEQAAEYSRGLQNFKKIIQEKIKEIPNVYPFTMKFVIERDGTCTDLKIFGKDENKSEKIKRAILPIKEVWSPAKIEGQTVRSQYAIVFE